MAAEGSVAAAVAAVEVSQSRNRWQASQFLRPPKFRSPSRVRQRERKPGILVAEAMREAQVPNAASPTGSEPSGAAKHRGPPGRDNSSVTDHSGEGFRRRRSRSDGGSGRDCQNEGISYRRRPKRPQRPLRLRQRR